MTFLSCLYAVKNEQETKKMLDQVNDAIRVKQYSYKTGQS